jgi:FkbM family methyltransferase
MICIFRRYRTVTPAVTLDFLLQNEPRVDILKMDVEGAEAKAGSA